MKWKTNEHNSGQRSEKPYLYALRAIYLKKIYVWQYSGLYDFFKERFKLINKN